MDQKEMNEQVGKMLSENPAKFIKIRGILDDMFEGRTLEGSKDISDREFERLRYAQFVCEQRGGLSAAKGGKISPYPVQKQIRRPSHN